MAPADLAYVLDVLRREWKWQKALGPATDTPERALQRQAAIEEAVKLLTARAQPAAQP
jgi:AmiR/NasT family two-component response regulator